MNRRTFHRSSGLLVAGAMPSGTASGNPPDAPQARDDTRPFTWDEIAAKFRELTAGRLDGSLGDEVVASVKGMESTDVADLMKLLARARQGD